MDLKYDVYITLKYVVLIKGLYVSYGMLTDNRQVQIQFKPLYLMKYSLFIMTCQDQVYAKKSQHQIWILSHILLVANSSWSISLKRASQKTTNDICPEFYFLYLNNGMNVTSVQPYMGNDVIYYCVMYSFPIA